MWQPNTVDKQLINMAFAEDLGQPYNDLTTNMMFTDEAKQGQASIISKEPNPLILCGLPLIPRILENLSMECELKAEYKDGDIIPPQARILTITGPLHILLMAERIMLNFLQPLSAIATLTREYVTKVAHTKAKILDTRKTLAGFRHLAKYAVLCGGGVNHRMGLYDAVMIKDTHIDFLGGMSCALNKIPQDFSQQLPVIVEVRTQEELQIVIDLGRNKVTRVLLDNMSPENMHACVLLCKGIFPTEASGNVNLENVTAIAESGVDYISIGKLTHSAGSVDLSMKGLKICSK